MRFLDPIREKELLAAAKRKREAVEIQRKLQPLFDGIAREHTPKVIKPKPYDAWSYPERSIPYWMRGIRSCGSCRGNGYVWLELSGDAFGWVRCTACRSKLVEAKETL